MTATYLRRITVLTLMTLALGSAAAGPAADPGTTYTDRFYFGRPSLKVEFKPDLIIQYLGTIYGATTDGSTVNYVGIRVLNTGMSNAPASRLGFATYSPWIFSWKRVDVPSIPAGSSHVFFLLALESWESPVFKYSFAADSHEEIAELLNEWNNALTVYLP